MKQIPIFIDTDPGVDDSLALMLACLSPQLRVLGVSTVYGNSNLANTTRNALTILQLLGQDIPVYRGANKPLKNKAVAASSHGDNGLGGFALEKVLLQPSPLSLLKALDQLTREIPAQSLRVICLGPTTNLARIAKLKPDLLSKIKDITILGGVFGEPGNITPVAEFNVINDPTALSILLDAPVTKTIIPINICRKVLFTLDELSSLNNQVLSGSLSQITKNYIKYYQENEVFGGFKGGVMYDLLAVSYVLRPEVFLTQKSCVQVETNPGPAFGQTTLNPALSPNCTVVTDVDAEAVKKMFIETCEKPQSPFINVTIN